MKIFIFYVAILFCVIDFTMNNFSFGHFIKFHSINNIYEALDTSHTIMCLSRYERIKSCITLTHNPKWTQDVWAIHTDTIIDEELLKVIDIYMGVPRCDNKLAYAFYTYGWKIVNPCKYIITTHCNW